MRIYTRPRVSRHHFSLTVLVAGILFHLVVFNQDSFAQIVPAPGGSSFSTQNLTLQENQSFLHNTVNDQCCFEQLNGTPVDRGQTQILPGLVDFEAGFQGDGVDFRGDGDPTARGCINGTCFSIPEIPVGADTQFGNGVPAGTSDGSFAFSLPMSLEQREEIVATQGSNTSAPFSVDFSIKHNIDPVTGGSLPIINSRPDGASGNRLNTIQFGFQQSGQSGVPGGERGGPVSILNGDSRDSGKGSGCEFCGAEGERVSRQQNFGMFFTIDSTTDSSGNMIGNATGTFTQTLMMSDVLAPNDTASCGSPGCVGQIGPVTIEGTFTFDGTSVEIVTEGIAINGVSQTVGSTDPLGVPTNQTIIVSPPSP